MIFFRKDVPYDDVKSHKNQGFILSFENAFSEKTTGDEGRGAN